MAGIDTLNPAGRVRMDASRNAFAQRMLDKPMPESLNSDPMHRFFYDPPELIQQAFGGRAWFHEVGNSCVHRVGLFRGLGWNLSELIVRQDKRGINAVIVSARAQMPGKSQLYDILFLHRPDLEDDDDTLKTVYHRPGLEAHQLKSAYSDVLGEHAV